MKKIFSCLICFSLMFSLSACTGRVAEENFSLQAASHPEDVPKPAVTFVNDKTIQDGDLTPEELEAQLAVNHDLWMGLLKNQQVDWQDSKIVEKAVNKAMLTYAQMDGLGYLDRLRTPEALMKAYFARLDDNLSFNERVVAFQQAYPVAAGPLAGYFHVTAKHLQAIDQEPNSQDKAESLVRTYEKNLQAYHNRHPKDLYTSEKINRQMKLNFYRDGTVGLVSQ